MVQRSDGSVVVVNRHAKSLTVLDGGPAGPAAPVTPGGEEAAAADGGTPDGAVIAQGSFDVALPVVAVGAGALSLAGAAVLVVVLRRRRKVRGEGASEAWALE